MAPQMLKRVDDSDRAPLIPRCHTQSVDYCGSCEVGRKYNCPHSQGIHYDPWGEGIGSPDSCPNLADPLPW